MLHNTMYSRNLLNEDTGSTSQGKGGRYETKKTRNKADVCRSHGGFYGAVCGGCERLGRDGCKGGGDGSGKKSQIFINGLNTNY